MTNGPRRDRRYNDSEPVSAGEVARWQQRHEDQSDRAHRDFARMISALDDKTDKLTVRVAVILGVSSVLWAILLVLAPILRPLLGLPA